MAMFTKTESRMGCRWEEAGTGLGMFQHPPWEASGIERIAYRAEISIYSCKIGGISAGCQKMSLKKTGIIPTGAGIPASPHAAVNQDIFFLDSCALMTV